LGKKKEWGREERGGLRLPVYNLHSPKKNPCYVSSRSLGQRGGSHVPAKKKKRKPKW